MSWVSCGDELHFLFCDKSRSGLSFSGEFENSEEVLLVFLEQR